VKIYIEAYDQNGLPVLGNLDGQAVIRTPNYRRTIAYKRVRDLPRRQLSLNGMVREYRVVTENDAILETIYKRL